MHPDASSELDYITRANPENKPKLHRKRNGRRNWVVGESIGSAARFRGDFPRIQAGFGWFRFFERSIKIIEFFFKNILKTKAKSLKSWFCWFWSIMITKIEILRTPDSSEANSATPPRPSTLISTKTRTWSRTRAPNYRCHWTLRNDALHTSKTEKTPHKLINHCDHCTTIVFSIDVNYISHPHSKKVFWSKLCDTNDERVFCEKL